MTNRKYSISVDELVKRAQHSLETSPRSCVRIEYEGRIPRLLPKKLEAQGIPYELAGDKEKVLSSEEYYVIDLTQIRQTR